MEVRYTPIAITAIFAIYGTVSGTVVTDTGVEVVFVICVIAESLINVRPGLGFNIWHFEEDTLRGEGLTILKEWMN